MMTRCWRKLHFLTGGVELFFFSLLILTGEEDHHLQVTQHSRHLHTEVSVISDINVSQLQVGVITCTPDALFVDGVD